MQACVKNLGKIRNRKFTFFTALFLNHIPPSHNLSYSNISRCLSCLVTFCFERDMSCNKETIAKNKICIRGYWRSLYWTFSKLFWLYFTGWNTEYLTFACSLSPPAPLEVTVLWNTLFKAVLIGCWLGTEITHISFYLTPCSVILLVLFECHSRIIFTRGNQKIV